MPDWPIRFNLPAPAAALPHNKETAGAQGHLRHQVALCTSQLKEALWEWAVFCREIGDLDKALQALHRLLFLVEDAESLAFYLLSLGQLQEQIGDFEAAIVTYSEGLENESIALRVHYFLRNNLGYCFNQCGRHEEAEIQCRVAIVIDPMRHNAHKNLGLSLQGQTQFAEAAQSFVTATQCCASDGRALQHLEQLVDEHPELRQQWPGLTDELARCREAVNIAQFIGSRIDSPPHRLS